MLMAVFAAIQPNIAPLAVDLAIPVRSAALLITTLALAVVVGRILGGYLCDRMGLRTMWLAIVCVEICAIALLTQSPGLARLHVGLSLVGLGSGALTPLQATLRSEEHTSELQSLMRISYAVFCLKIQNTLIPVHTQSVRNTTNQLLPYNHK